MKRKNLFLTVAAILLGGFVMAACSDSDDNKSNGGNGGSGTAQTATDVVIMFYAVGGGDLDDDNEEDFVRAASQLYESQNVRYFAQYKYSGKEGYDKNMAKLHAKYPNYNYVMSGDYGCVYRFELSWNIINPACVDANREINFGTGQTAFRDLTPYKYGDANFKMYAPSNLAAFIQWVMQQTPNAKTYMLTIGDHGGSYDIVRDAPKQGSAAAPAVTRGIMYDDNLTDSPCMSPQEIAQAFSMLTAEQRSKIQLLYFDCCLMSNLEVLGEVKDCAPYILGSSHSVTASNHGLLVKHMATIAKNGMAKTASNYLQELLEQKRTAYLNGGRKNANLMNIDYTLTDVSKLDATYAAIKDVTDFMVKQDVSNTDVFTQAASKCYQFYNEYPYFDVVDYLAQLKNYAFPNNTEFAALADKATTAIRAAIADHADYNYSLDPVNGSSRNLTYSVTIGFNSKALNLSKSYNEDHAAVMVVTKGGQGTDAKYDPFFSEVLTDNGDIFSIEWMDKNYKQTNKETFKFALNKPQCSWDKTYKTLYFDKKTGWSSWMLKNPGAPLNNPPTGDEDDDIMDTYPTR